MITSQRHELVQTHLACEVAGFCNEYAGGQEKLESLAYMHGYFLEINGVAIATGEYCSQYCVSLVMFEWDVSLLIQHG